MVANIDFSGVDYAGARLLRSTAELLYEKDAHFDLVARLLGLFACDEPAECVQCGDWTPDVFDETQDVELTYERVHNGDKLLVHVRVTVDLDDGQACGDWDYQVTSASVQLKGLQTDLGTAVQLTPSEREDVERFANERLNELPLLRATAARDDEMERAVEAHVI